MQKINKNNFVSNLLAIFIIYILINMVIFPKFYIQQTFNGISAWALNVLPSILPFIFFTKILSTTNFLEKFTKVFKKPFEKFFKVPAISSYVFLSSIISGYPIGAKVTEELYLSNKISRNDACKILSFSSTSGPMFIIGAVGAVMFNNITAGYIIFFSHVLSAFLNGFLYRNIKVKEFSSKPASNQKNNIDINSIVLDTSLSVISVGTIIAVFFVVITSLTPIFSILPNFVAIFLSGIVEITKGCLDIATYLPLFWATLLATFIISFGGISTIIQTKTMTKNIKLPVKLYVLQKFTHAVISTIIAFLFCIICF